MDTTILTDQQILFADTWCSLEDLPGVIFSKGECRQKERNSKDLFLSTLLNDNYAENMVSSIPI